MKRRLKHASITAAAQIELSGAAAAEDSEITLYSFAGAKAINGFDFQQGELQHWSRIGDGAFETVHRNAFCSAVE